MIETLPKQDLNPTLVQEESLLNWEDITSKFLKTFGKDVYESLIKNINLNKEFNHYVILSAPTRFVRDWVVSRYADKILDIIKDFKKSIQRIEFLIEESDTKSLKAENTKKSPVTSLENTILNYNQFNINNSFANFVVGPSNELAYTAAKKICIESYHYNPLFI